MKRLNVRCLRRGDTTAPTAAEHDRNFFARAGSNSLLVFERHVMREWLCGIVAAAALTACAGLPPQGSTRAEVIASLGEPTERRIGVAGEEVWEYWAGYAGRETFIVRFDGNGQVTAANQVLTEAAFAALPRGAATRQDVRDAVGKPVRRVTYPTGEVWEYLISDIARRPTKMAVQFGHDGLLKEISKIQQAVSHGISFRFH